MIVDSHCHAWRRWPYQPPVPDPESRGLVEQLLWEMDRHGVDRAAVVDAALKSVIASPVIGYRAPLLVVDNAVYADVELQQKDLVLAQELGRKLGAAVPTCSAASEMLSAARSSDSSDRDFLVSVADTYRRMAGIPT